MDDLLEDTLAFRLQRWKHFQSLEYLEKFNASQAEATILGCLTLP
jgi:hypothetical protein